MSRQLAISATLSIFAMSAFLLFGGEVSFDTIMPTVDVPAVHMPSAPFDTSEWVRR